MNGFLVVLRHSMDDIPLLLTADINREEALDFASKVTPESGAEEQDIIGSVQERQTRGR